ncbi:hypothetical protein ASG01_06690 [Chryseobacterium sp. Leaf180]|uniref:hypothetical protein n=1 Tax=Chryseobacterium sp. Leaf180 TaxID=1736289 RepID=UPI0006F63D75|nr:hypothetical protein [Chryseobacterium sp. Leaf180]KQR95522.1 hypothetical protein ASG01_06690 [Chryseobacterium sp. Leaf180]
MTDLDLIHFEQLKTVVQAQYLKEHTPSFDEISKWKGIDIIYFQEDLRKRAKGNISEKSFYTYFKSSPVSKLPRIDMLNLLSIYAGFESWYDFKKQHLFAGELLIENPENETELISEKEFSNSDDEFKVSQQSNAQNSIKKDVLQESKTENQDVNNIATISENQLVNEIKPISKSSQKWIWIAVSSIIVSLLAFIGFKDEIFQKHYTYCFTDADRNLKVQSTIEIKVFKENESPLFYRINPGECFIYETKDKILKMQISSTVYENLEINRSLENAPEEETIELKPDDYKMALLYFSTKDVSGNPSEQISLKRKQLENLISNDAVIYQVYDNEIYGVETLDKQKYITLVTTPTTSLKNLSYIEMKKDKKGKIVSIKFKISNNENTK